jgi:DNA-binding MarR family transcriptional regulator
MDIAAPIAPGPADGALATTAGPDPDLALEVADLLGQAVRRLHRGTNEALAPLGLSRTQARVVRLLADGPLRMAAIAERLAVVPRTEDRRATFVALTPEGRRLLDRLQAARRESARQVLGQVADGDLAAMHRVLRDVLAASSPDCRDGTATSQGAPGGARRSDR